MRISEESIDKITTIFNGEPVIVGKAFRIVPAENPPENDLFNTRVGNILKDEKAVISENGYIELKNGKKYKCIYHTEWASQSMLRFQVIRLGRMKDCLSSLISNVQGIEKSSFALEETAE